MRKCNMRWFSPQRMKKHLAFALAVSLSSYGTCECLRSSTKDFNDKDQCIH